jgi:hypothetical protein
MKARYGETLVRDELFVHAHGSPRVEGRVI